MTVPALRTIWVVFEVPGSLPALVPARRAECDRHWNGLGITGAFMVVDLLSDVAERIGERISPVICRDRLLTLNIAHRVRDGFVHSRFPLIDRPDPEPHHWATDDPRLARLVCKEVV